MNTAQRDKVKEVFLSAADLESADRPAYLDGACGGDREVREEVESLLAAEALPPLRTGPGVLAPRGFGPGLLGRRVGNYVVKALIGEGGMGVVYLAEQERPKRDVALKVMRTGIASTSALRRFQEESQTLARLEHQSIARIYESGVYEADREQVPYFAMEFIADAKPITEYAKERSLSTQEKLALFATVCDAVQCGHQKGIIHRDLKPQNILVGSGGAAKVIDFGVARSIGPDQPMTTLHTGVGQLIGTLLYMSPEQWDADPRDVDTRSDVYALGVVLYELLAECRPYNIGSGTLPRAVKAIWDQPPARLSSINARLRGDLEAITFKAMEKDRTRRYQSAEELSADIRRYLDQRPIKARPPSRRYLMGMWVRRNKVASAAAAVAVLSLVVGLIMALVSRGHAVSARGQAELARGEAQTVVDFIVGFLKSQDPSNWDAVPFLEAMAIAAKDVDGGVLKNQPPAVLRAISGILGGNGRVTEARPLAERALTLERARHTGDHSDVAASLTILAAISDAMGDDDEAERLFVEALRMNRRLHSDVHEEVARSLGDLAGLVRNAGRYEEAERLVAEARAIREQLLPSGHASIAASLSGHAHVLELLKRYAEAEELYVRAHEIITTLHPGDNRVVTGSLNSLAWVNAELGRSDEAVRYEHEALEMHRRMVKGDSSGAAYCLKQLGGIHRYLGQLQEGERRHAEALAMYRRLHDGDHFEIAGCLNDLAHVRQLLGRTVEAERMYQQSLEMWQRLYEGDYASTASVLADLARCRAALGLSDAQQMATEAAAMAGRILPKGHEIRKKCDGVLKKLEGLDAN